MARVIPSEGAGGGAGGISGSGDPTFVTTADPNTKYTDTATGDIYIHVGSSANNYDWMNVTQGGIRNPLTLLGSTDLRRWVDTIYGEGISYRTDVGIDRLYDLTGNGWDYIQDTDAEQPTIHATQGPGSTSEVDLGAATSLRLVSSGAVALSGERPTFLTIARAVSNVSAYQAAVVWGSDRKMLVGNRNASEFNPYGHGTQMIQTSPALDTNYHVFRQSYSATANVLKIDGVSATLTSPPAAFTNGTALSENIGASYIGIGSSASGGGVAADLCVGRDLTVSELVEIGKFYNWKRSIAITSFVKIG